MEVTLTHAAIGESRDGKAQKKFAAGTAGEYVCHVPCGMIVLNIDGTEWIIHPGATMPPKYVRKAMPRA